MMESSTYKAGSLRIGDVYAVVSHVQDLLPMYCGVSRDESCLTVLMCSSRALEIACACSVFSFAMIVRLLISYLLLPWRSLRDSVKSCATSVEEAPEKELLGDLADMT